MPRRLFLAKPLVILVLVSARLADAQQDVGQCRLGGSGRDEADLCNSDGLFHSKYRSMDGTCNHLRNPTWAAANTPFLRLLTADYSAILSFASPRPHQPPIGNRANPRRLSLTVMKAEKGKVVKMDKRHNAMLAHWGQFLAHDITMAEEADANCSANSRFGTEKEREACFNIPIRAGDRRRPEELAFPFKRTKSCLDFGRREQINKLTAYIDASQVYGSSETVGRLVRSFQSGQLRTRVLPNWRKAFLPLDFAGHSQCFPTRKAEEERRRRPTGRCSLAADVRANEQLALTALHTMFVREHNRVALALAQVNPEWSDDVLYHETRKILGAISQHVTYTYWLPAVLGPVGMQLLGNYKGYSEETNPTMANSVSAAALRFGHAFVVPVLERMDSSFRPEKVEPHIRLRDAFFAPENLVKFGIDSIIRGAVGSPLKDIRPEGGLINGELTEHLFAGLHGFPLDLAAMNIQRGRDHGLPPYNAFRRLCGLPAIHNWAMFRREVRDARLVDKGLRKLYGRIGKVDLWVGGLLERPLRGAKIGRTFTCLLADQFRRLRDGDRHAFISVLNRPECMHGMFSLSLVWCRFRLWHR